jgi:hypothetical protein
MKGKMPDYYEKWQEQNILDQKITEIQDCKCQLKNV